MAKYGSKYGEEYVFQSDDRSIHSSVMGRTKSGAKHLVNGFGDRSDRFSTRQSVMTQTHEYETNRPSVMQKQLQKSLKDANVHVDDPENVTYNGRDIFENYYDKDANTVFRWNLIWLPFIFLSPYPLWLPWINCALNAEITFVIGCIVSVNYIYTTILCWQYMWKMIRSFNTPYWQELDPELREKVQHIVVMPTYKEPVELLCETISSVANQSVAESIIMVVGMEEKTPKQEEKKRIMTDRFGDSFKALVFCAHPSGTPGEIPGACSNRNYAARQAVKYMIAKGLLPIDPETKSVELDFATCTVCDADTTFFYRYFENLTWAFLTEDPKSRYCVCWQSPLFYNIGLDERYWFTRAMGIIRSYFMVGFLIGCDINTMSIYSMSLRLLVESKFFHPGYQMDDIIYTLSAMKSTGGRIRIRTVDIPTLSGPTSGENMWGEWVEYVVQAERWTIGAAEVFHYFFVKLLKRNYVWPGFEYFFWFCYYYLFILCCAGIIGITSTIMAFVSIGVEQVKMGPGCQPFGIRADFNFAWLICVFHMYNYITVYGTAFCMDALASNILALDEHVNPIRNLLHWISSQIALWSYNLVELKAIFKITIYGKSVCGHKASEKHALVGVSADKMETAGGGVGLSDDQPVPQQVAGV